MRAKVSGLDPNTEYYYRVRAENSVGTTIGAVDSVTTRIAPPTVATEAPTVESDTSTVLKGTVNPGGDTTAVYAALARSGNDLTSDSMLVDSLEPLACGSTPCGRAWRTTIG